MPYHVTDEPITVANVKQSLKEKNIAMDTSVALSFYIEVHKEGLAKELAKDLESEGFDTDIDAFQQLQGKWRCWASVKIIPTILNLDWIVTLLVDKCERFECSLEGWEANVSDSGVELGHLMARLEKQCELSD